MGGCEIRERTINDYHFPSYTYHYLKLNASLTGPVEDLTRVGIARVMGDVIIHHDHDVIITESTSLQDLIKIIGFDVLLKLMWVLGNERKQLRWSYYSAQCYV